MKELAIISGRSNLPLTKKILDFLGSGKILVPTEIKDFPNKEIFIRYRKSIRGKDVFIIQSFNNDPNKDLVELLLLADTAFNSSARRVTVILPYLYGSRQDRKSYPRTPVTPSTLAKVLKAVETNRVVTVSLHSPQSSSAFFSAGLRFDNLSSAGIFLPEIKKLHKKKDFVIVSPDVGGISKARFYAKIIDADLAFADKRRPKHSKSKIINLVGEVSGRHCFFIDDMIDTGGSVINLIEVLLQKGALSVSGLATHLILSNNAKHIFSFSPVEYIYGTDSIHQPNLPEKFRIKTIGNLLGDVISRIHRDISVGETIENIKE